MNNRFRQTTFFRLSSVFIVAGVLPLVLVMILFVVRYNVYTSNAINDNYTQITYYLSENISDVFEEIDDTMGYLYEYGTERYPHLYELLEADNMEIYEKSNEIYPMLYEILLQNTAISSVRFADNDGKVYAYFENQGKILREGKESYNMPQWESVNEYRDLKIMPTVREEEYCMNSDDYVFTMARNYMDTSHVQAVRTDRLGTLLVDVNTEALDKITERINHKIERQIYVVNAENQTLIYSENKEDYEEDTSGIVNYLSRFEGTGGSFQSGGDIWFYQTIGDTDCYVCVKLVDAVTTGQLLHNKTALLIMFIAGVFLLVFVYLSVSTRLSEPIRQLSNGMQQVQKGNLDVRTDIKTNDEMQVLSDGFNQMLDDLNRYIDEMYVAQIKQKEAEMQALKTQIQPHYLYNTLDVIRMTAVEHDDTTTAELLLSLSAQLRYVMGKQNDRVRLADEIQNIQMYFVIAKVRYENRISLEINVADDVRELYVLKLLLQPIVENAVSHGLKPRRGAGKLSLSAQRREDFLEITVMDDGVGIPPQEVEQINQILSYGPQYEDKEHRMGVGMKNVSDRIKINCGSEYGYTVSSYEEIGTVVRFKLPVWEVETDVEGSHS